MSHTKKQKLQKGRAYFKFVLAGLFKPIDLKQLTNEELEAWKLILNTREHLLAIHDANSKILGLKIPEHRCWCRKEGKYKPEYDYVGLVCKKHIRMGTNE